MDKVDETLADRNVRYNAGKGHTENCDLAYRLRELYRRHRGSPMTPEMRSHDHCIEMILGKIARIATGAVVEDNYHDIQGYCRLALTDAMNFKKQIAAPIAYAAVRCTASYLSHPGATPVQCTKSGGHTDWHNFPTPAYVEGEPTRCPHMKVKSDGTYQCSSDYNHAGDHNFGGKVC